MVLTFKTLRNLEVILMNHYFTGSDVATDRDIPLSPSAITQVEYKRSRRPNLNKSKSPANQNPVSSSPARSDLPTGAVTGQLTPPPALRKAQDSPISPKSAAELTVDLKNLLKIKSDQENISGPAHKDVTKHDTPGMSSYLITGETLIGTNARDAEEKCRFALKI